MHGLFWYLDSPNVSCARFTTVSSHTMIATIVIQFCFLKRTIFCWSIIYYLEGNWGSPSMVLNIAVAQKKCWAHLLKILISITYEAGRILAIDSNWHFKVNRRILRHWILFIFWVIAVACLWHFARTFWACSSKGKIGITGRIVSASGQIFRPDFCPQDEIIWPRMAFGSLYRHRPI